MIGRLRVGHVSRSSRSPCVWKHWNGDSNELGTAGYASYGRALAPVRKAKTGVGCGGFHPKVPLGVKKKPEELLEKLEQSGKWPQQACTTMFFLIPENVTSERPISLMPTLQR